MGRAARSSGSAQSRSDSAQLCLLWRRRCRFIVCLDCVASFLTIRSKHSASLTNVVAKVSCGALEFQPIYEVGSIRRFLSVCLLQLLLLLTSEKSKEFGWQIIGTSCSNVNSGLRSIDATLPSVVVFGMPVFTTAGVYSHLQEMKEKESPMQFWPNAIKS